MSTFSAYQILTKKRDNKELSSQEISWFINQYTEGKIPDYQMSALLMAIYLNGFSKKETKELTDTMLNSGATLNFEEQVYVDKHSTGGVGDKASFILAPLAKACGVKVPMIAGRGLGHTGGTIDKIESIKGFKTSMSLQDFEKTLKSSGLVLIGQTKNLAPADKKIYALRDVTATVESIPLITASIMSKKLAEGAKGIMMDIKVGNGAFMKSKTRARALAKSLRDTANRFDRHMITMITDMNQPLGHAVGNSIEVIESIETLKGNGPKDLTELSLHLAGGMVYLAGLAKSHEAGIKKAKKALKSGAALDAFQKMVIDQGGNGEVINDYTLLPMAKNIKEVLAPKKGFISKVECLKLGLHCVRLGGGRMKSEDAIDHGVGFLFPKKHGDKVKAGEVLAKIYYNDGQENIVAEVEEEILSSNFKISSKKPNELPLFYQTDISWAKSK